MKIYIYIFYSVSMYNIVYSFIYTIFLLKYRKKQTYYNNIYRSPIRYFVNSLFVLEKSRTSVNRIKIIIQTVCHW